VLFVGVSESAERRADVDADVGAVAGDAKVQRSRLPPRNAAGSKSGISAAIVDV
jgi:hypothetical protein